MRTATPEFVDSLRWPHVVAAACELIFPGTTERVTVAVESGNVRIDRTADNRRAGTITIPWSLEDDELDIRTLPLGGYARVYRGLRYATGATELILLGHLRVESVSWDTLARSASIELADRMAQVRDEPFTAPYAAKGKTAWQVAYAVVYAVFGASIGYSAPFNPPGVIGDVFYSGERTDALQALRDGYGAETYFNADGNFVFAQKPGATGTPVWTVDAGEEGVMVNAAENLDRTGIYNGVLMQGQESGDLPPVSALATYTTPTSPIRWGGPFGKVLLIADSSNVTTTAQALAGAQALLKLRLKQTRNLELTAAPNPTLEAGDTIRVVFPDGRDELHLVDAVEIDLSTGSMSVVTRTDADPGTFETFTGTAIAEQIRGASVGTG